MNRIVASLRGQRAHARRAIRTAIQLRHAEEHRRAGLLGRFVLWFHIERETAAELNRRFPPSALHATGAVH